MALRCALVAPDEQTDRADPITRVLARRVAELRKAAGMNQAQLGERMAELLPKWSRSTVVKLETYKRESVSTADLFALALALGVPPVILLADPRQPGAVPVAPGLEVDQWDALAWLTGTAGLNKAGDRIEYRRMGQDGADAGWLIYMSFLLAEALDTLGAPMLTGVRDDDGRLTRDPEAIRRKTDEQHHDALSRVCDVLSRIERDGTAPLPDVGEHVRRRAVELGVELPGMGG